MYIAELVPRRLCGGVVSFNHLFVTLGIVCAYIADWGFAGFSDNWRWMFAIRRNPRPGARGGHVLHAVLAALARRQGREEEAEAEAFLMDVRDSEEDVREEIVELERVAAEEASLGELALKKVRPMLLVGIGLAVFQQIVGINTVIYYGPTILEFAGQQNAGALQEAVFIAILLLDRLGRRFFLLTGTSILLVALVGLGFFFDMPWLQAHGASTSRSPTRS